MAAPKLEKRKPVTLAYIEHVGPYDRIPFDSLIPRLYGWVKEKKIIPGFYPIGIFYSDPKTTAPELCRTDVAITVKGNPRPEGDIKIRKLPAMTVATLSHKGPGSEYQRSYDTLTEFVRKKGYFISGPPMEIYSKKPEVVGDETVLYAKIMFPVKK
ncbi:MAG: GyrI-like domain-containing protein [Candidatus Thermoplasmatota archaeon]|nr:GyrI-like domain-containing protein [Candidatus Thermoplasmatota archaeon]